MRTPLSIITACAAVVAVASCTDAPVAPVTMASPHLAAAKANSALSLYGHGSKAGLITACNAPGYKQLDFWLGHWEARHQLSSGGFFPSLIEKELDGCVLEENWASNARSINTYDAATDSYHQQYVDQTGFHLLLDGGKQLDGSVRMFEHATLNCPTCPGGVFAAHDVWTFTQVNPDSVRQQQQFINPSNSAVIFSGWDGRYRRVAPFTMTFTDGPSPCANNAIYQQFDFAIGDWIITNGTAKGRAVAHGNGPVQATVSRALRGCLVEEKIEGPGGYRGWSFNAYKANVNYQRWYRTYADNLGGRVFLSGSLVNGAMVMTGHRSTADGTKQLVRVTFTPDGGDRVIERWEVPAGDGSTYKVAEEVVRIRRASAD